MLRAAAIAASGAVLLAIATVAAAAAPGIATGSVNLRAGPGTGYARIATIPAGARVNVLRCGGWCEVVFNGRRGWASAAYIGRGGVRTPPRPRGGYVILPDQSLCHGPQAWSLPFCETPIERSMRDFEQSNRDWNARQRGRR
jgi:SH3-like domain-containing protein